MHTIKRGAIYYADLTPTLGSEQGGIRPVLIVQNNMGNTHSPTVIIASITSRTGKRPLPTHFCLPHIPPLRRSSIVLLEQLRTLDKCRLYQYIGRLNDDVMSGVDRALAISVGLEDIKNLIQDGGRAR